MFPVPSQVNAVNATIAGGASLSPSIYFGRLKSGGSLGASPVRLFTPAGLEGTVLTFQTSYDGVNWFDLYDVFGSEYTAQLDVSSPQASARAINLPAVDLLGVNWLKIRTGTSASPTTQSADRIIGVVLKES